MGRGFTHWVIGCVGYARRCGLPTTCRHSIRKWETSRDAIPRAMYAHRARGSTCSPHPVGIHPVGQRAARSLPERWPALSLAGPRFHPAVKAINSRTVALRQKRHRGGRDQQHGQAGERDSAPFRRGASQAGGVQSESVRNSLSGQ
jgi:hypothetical protein